MKHFFVILFFFSFCFCIQSQEVVSDKLYRDVSFQIYFEFFNDLYQINPTNSPETFKKYYVYDLVQLQY